ncbi:MAG: WD40 repeat domain-containing protein [Bacteroidota bacterium]
MKTLSSTFTAIFLPICIAITPLAAAESETFEPDLKGFYDYLCETCNDWWRSDISPLIEELESHYDLQKIDLIDDSTWEDFSEKVKEAFQPLNELFRLKERFFSKPGHHVYHSLVDKELAKDYQYIQKILSQCESKKNDFLTFVKILYSLLMNSLLGKALIFSSNNNSTKYRKIWEEMHRLFRLCDDFFAFDSSWICSLLDDKMSQAKKINFERHLKKKYQNEINTLKNALHPCIEAKVMQEFTIEREHISHHINDLKPSYKDCYMACAHGSTLVIFDRLKGKKILRKVGKDPEDNMNRLNWSPRENTLIYTNRYGYIFMCKVSDDQEITNEEPLKVSKEKLLDLKFSNDGRFIAAAGYDKMIYILRASDRTVYEGINSPTGKPAWSLAWSPHDRFLVLGNCSSVISILDMRDYLKNSLSNPKDIKLIEQKSISLVHKKSLSLQYSQDGRYLLGTTHNQFIVWPWKAEKWNVEHKDIRNNTSISKKEIKGNVQDDSENESSNFLKDVSLNGQKPLVQGLFNNNGCSGSGISYDPKHECLLLAGNYKLELYLLRSGQRMMIKNGTPRFGDSFASTGFFNHSSRFFTAHSKIIKIWEVTPMYSKAFITGCIREWRQQGAENFPQEICDYIHSYLLFSLSHWCWKNIL